MTLVNLQGILFALLAEAVFLEAEPILFHARKPKLDGYGPWIIANGR